MRPDNYKNEFRYLPFNGCSFCPGGDHSYSPAPVYVIRAFFSSFFHAITHKYVIAGGSCSR